MSAPRLEINVAKITANAKSLVDLLNTRGISVTGVTKAALGCPIIASALISAGVNGLGDSRIENIERMRASLGDGPHMTLIRAPMLSQVERVVRHADTSFNTELAVIQALSDTATRLGRVHGIVLMVELGDLREGVMPGDLLDMVAAILPLPNITLQGIGTNLACLNGASPDANNMTALSNHARKIEQGFGVKLDVISGGNSANIDWALTQTDHGRINNLRLGEAILFGRETLGRMPIEGLHLNAFTLIAEVIEAKRKPSLAWGTIAQNAFGTTISLSDRGRVSQAILAIGRQDCDPDGLTLPVGTQLLGSSSDHLVMDTGTNPAIIGSEMSFGINYATLLRAMSSPFVEKLMV